MPDIPLELRTLNFVTDQKVTVRAWRAFVGVRFVKPTGTLIRYEGFVDPGAPFSVIPYSLWHGRGVQWAPLGAKLLRGGKTVPGALLWQEVACDLGATELYLVDLDSGIRTGPHTVVAKFPRGRVQPAVENAAVLGMSFLADNDLRLVLEGSEDSMTGFISVPEQ